MSRPDPLILAGRKSVSDPSITVCSPYDGSEIGCVSSAGEEDIETAIESGIEAADEMARIPTHRKMEILRRASVAIEGNREELARLIVREAGKPIRAARAEVDRASFTFAEGAREAGRQQGEWMPLDLVPWGEGAEALVRRFPIGLIIAITPFNFPLNLVAHKVAPAIAAGNPVIMKPSSQTPMTALALGEILLEAGLPPRALSILPMHSDYAGLLVADPRPAMVTFTGSPAVGWPLKGMAGKKRVTLELGGNAAVIVHDDADLDRALDACVAGGYGYAGQSCISVQRILVQRAAYPRFSESLADRVRGLVTGDPSEASTDVGPLISRKDAERVEQWIRDAVDAGARLLAGGTRDGSVVEPTVLTGVPPCCDICAKEVFGPVTLVDPYDTFDEALERANNSRYGLQAGLFTRDAGRIRRAFARLEVGGVIVNQASAYRIDHQPYGGVKDSGFGREGLRYAIEEMTERKILIQVH